MTYVSCHWQSSRSAQGEIFHQQVQKIIPVLYELRNFIQFLFVDETWPTAKDILKNVHFRIKLHAKSHPVYLAKTGSLCRNGWSRITYLTMVKE